MQIKIGRWYWTREGLVAWVRCRTPRRHAVRLDPAYVFWGVHLWMYHDEVATFDKETWTEKGWRHQASEGRMDLICEPASRERIVFPHPATCPRWYDVSKREQRESEEVLFT